MKRKFWNWVRNEAEEERTLVLNGQISDETWFGDEVTPKLFQKELDAGTGNITVWINSPGGDVFAAAQIYNMLMEYKGDVTVKVDALAASAASVIAMAGTTVLMSPVAMMMIHNPMTIAIGDSKEMQKAGEMLDEVKESIMNAYEIKTGLKRTKISHAKLMPVGQRDETATYPERIIQCCMRGGYLYVPAYNKKGIYKINTANSADVTLIEFGFTSKWKPLCETGSCEVYMTLIGDLIVAGDFQVTAEDTVIRTQGSFRLNDAATPLFQYKNFLVGWGGSYGNEYRTMYLLTPYLATINNLSSAVVKTVDKTMKITYTLTEEETV